MRLTFEFRAGILEILKTGPARAPEIAEVLTERGLANDSTTPLPTRVYNDLWRMKSAGVVEGSGGKFALRKQS